MSKLKKVIVMLFLFFTMCGTCCFADVIMPEERGVTYHGGGYRNNYTMNSYNNYYNRNNQYNGFIEREKNLVNKNSKKETEDNNDSTTTAAYIAIGVLILVIIFCTIMIIRNLVKNKEGEK